MTAAILLYQSAHALLLGGSPYRKLTRLSALFDRLAFPCLSSFPFFSRL